MRIIMVDKEQIETPESTVLNSVKKNDQNHHDKRVPYGWFALIAIILGSIIHTTISFVLFIIGTVSAIVWTIRAFQRGESKVKRWFVIAFLLIPLYAFIVAFIRIFK
jgi:hypothetical protein